jgi:hypothetical protein
MHRFQDPGAVRAQLVNGTMTPAMFRATLTSIPVELRERWIDEALGIDGVPDDGPELPRGCVPYLPSSVEVLLQLVEQADIRASDTFVDIGSGLGRAAVLTHFLTGAAAIGIEIQSALVSASRAIVSSLGASRVSIIEGDAVQLTGFLTIGSVFFLYCPFSGFRLEKVLASLERIARTREIRICCVDLPLTARAWLAEVLTPTDGVAVYRSTLLDNWSI